MEAASRTPGRSAGEVRDRRVLPQGVVPRRVQTWIMAGLSLVIITVILLSGRQEPPRPDTSFVGSEPAAPAPERIRNFRDELADRSAPPPDPLPAPTMLASEHAGTPTATEDPLAEDRRRRDYESLFAGNVAFSTRQGATTGAVRSAGTPSAAPTALPTPQELAAFQRALFPSVGGQSPAAVAQADPASPLPPSLVPPAAAAQQDGSGLRIVEGRVIEAVLLNRLDGTFSGPVTGLVTTPVYSEDRQSVLIPAGARLLGTAEAVDTWGDARLAVSFHRLLLPNGDSATLDQFTGLNQIGETGLRDLVDRHYLQVFGASVAIGALSGLAQWNTRGFGGDFGDASRQGAGASLATSSGRVLDRYLNVLPTVTIREGHRIKVYLTNDLRLPAYASVDPTSVSDGGVL